MNKRRELIFSRDTLIWRLFKANVYLFNHLISEINIHPCTVHKIIRYIRTTYTSSNERYAALQFTCIQNNMMLRKFNVLSGDAPL